MGSKSVYITEKHIEFINQQHIFFTATATNSSRINLSPKEINSLKIVDKNMVIWLNKVGSGNETSAHMQADNRMTIMFCSFTKKPSIMRLYGRAIEIKPSNQKWSNFLNLFDNKIGARQIFALDVDLVQVSCGFGVPFFDFKGNRKDLDNWALKKGEDGLEEYKQNRNTLSLDGVKINL